VTVGATPASGERRVLFLAYMFPPTGGGGVQRSVKFVKYLPQAGWQPIVLTVKPISYYVYDRSLLEEIPPEVRIERSESLDPLRVSALLLGDARRSAASGRVQHDVYASGSRAVALYRRLRAYAFFPDTQVGWIPFAYARGVSIVKRERPSVIYSPGAPYSSAVAAHLLARRTGLPYVIDFRDGWTDDQYQHVPTRAHRAAHRALERRVVTGAAAVCVYGRWLGDRLAERYPEVADRIVEITNGFDPADMDGVVPAPRSEGRHRVVYTGSLFPHHREVLATVLAALRRLDARLLASLEVIFVGQVYDGAREEVEAAGLGDVVRFTGYLSHGEALAYLLSADASLLLVRAGDRASVTGKVFELLSARRPILAAVEPEGECARILRLAGADQWIAHPNDADSVARHLCRLASAGFPALESASVEQFSRVAQTRTLASVFDAARTGLRPVTP
jgi:glycosyltransferase involved in cell wall biosynthesis